MLEIPFLDWLLNISNNAVMIGVTFMVQSTIILIAGLCTVHVMRQRGAAVQSLILRVFLCAVFLCPLLSIFIHEAGFSRLTFNQKNSPMLASELNCCDRYEVVIAL